MDQRTITDNYDILSEDIKENLHKSDQEIGYRHYCVFLRKGTNNWKGKAGSWM